MIYPIFSCGVALAKAASNPSKVAFSKNSLSFIFSYSRDKIPKAIVPTKKMTVYIYTLSKCLRRFI